MQILDLNCDLGEGFNNDALLMDYITSANIACGYHAGDVATMHKTVACACKKGVAIGAHPGFNDKPNFGRTAMNLPPASVYQIVFEQLTILNNVVKAEGTSLHHVKTHGALYNMAAKNVEMAEAIAKAVHDFNPKLILYGLAGSQMITAAQGVGLRTASEVFADRTYQNDGSLTPRSEKDALISDENYMIQQVLRMAKNREVVSKDNVSVNIQAETLCLHGDGAHAVQFARTIYNKLIAEGIIIKAV